MTDEFYTCDNCGIFEGGANTEYKISNTLTSDEIEQIEALGIEIDYEEIQICKACGQESTFSCAVHTGY